MSVKPFHTLVIDGEEQDPESAFSIFTTKQPNAHVAHLHSADDAVKHLNDERVSLLLVSVNVPDYRKILQTASVVGLDVELLFEINSEHSECGRHLYLCRTSFNTMKFACHLLQSCGIWWEIQSTEAPAHERYRKLLNRVSEGILEVGPTDKILWANNAFRDLVGNRDTEYESVVDVVADQDIPCLKAVLQQLRSGIISPYMVRLRSGVIVEVDSTPRFGLGGVYMGSVSLIRPAEHSRNDEFEASRNLGSLYSLALSLSRAFGVPEIIRVVTSTIREMCGYCCVGVALKDREPVFDAEKSQNISPVIRDAISSFCSRLGPTHMIRVIKDLDHDPDETTEILRAEGYKGLACVPLVSGTERLGVLWGLADKGSSLARERSSFLISVGVQAGMALQNAIHVQARLDEEAHRRHFYRDALQALTSGKLFFCEHDELDQHWQECGNELATLQLVAYSDIPDSRHLAEEYMEKQGFSGERLFDMVTCVSEAATNVVKYGPPGSMAIKGDENGIRVRLDDVGPGIAFANLPKAVLLSGFSTGAMPSLGLGYSVILELCDCVYLATSSQGTSLILEMVHKTADPLDAFVGFAKADTSA